MTKKDIARGDLVLLGDGRVCIVWEDLNDPNGGLVLYGVLNLHGPFLVDCIRPFGIVSCVDRYDDDLTLSYDDSSYTIMAVMENPIGSAACLFEMLTNDSIDKDQYHWDWKREKIIKEVTMAEVEEHFGCKVKIVKEESDG